jgi:SAM-dependent methyltransferase
MTERFVPGGTDTLSRFEAAHHQARYRWAVEQLEGVGGLVVDIAAGSGYGSHMLARDPERQVVGIDVSDDALANARASYAAPNLRFQTGDAETLREFESQSVSAVVSFETIEHLRHPQHFLAEAARILKPGGVLLISTPNRLLASTLYPLRGRPNNPYHVFEYTRDGFLADLSRDFRVDLMAGQSYVPRWLACWPVQVAIKAFCHALRGFGAYRFVDRHYHDPQQVNVESTAHFPQALPSNFVARCTPRRARA